jgi:hypothetical protein
MTVSEIENRVIDESIAKRERLIKGDGPIDDIAEALSEMDLNADNRMKSAATVPHESTYLFDIEIPESGMSGELPDNYFVSGTTATRIKGISPEHLSKIWKIDN